jgi:hypothetical protein
MAFEDILRSIAEETDRAAFFAVAEKHPSLKKYIELGEQAQNAMPFLERARKAIKNPDLDIPKALEAEASWEEWKASNWDDVAKMTHPQKRAVDMLASAETDLAATRARVAELEARGETEMTGEEIDALVNKRLEERGVVTRADLPKLLPMDRLMDKDGNPLVATRGDVNDSLNRIGGRFQEIYKDLTPQMIEHHATFGKQLEMQKVYDVMEAEFKATGRPMEPLAAYKKAYAPEFAERETANRAKEIQEAEARGEQKGRQMVTQSQNGRGIPLSGGGVSQGPLMKRYLSKQTTSEAGKPIDAPLGKGLIAQDAAAKFQQKADGVGAL